MNFIKPNISGSVGVQLYIRSSDIKGNVSRFKTLDFTTDQSLGANLMNT